MCRPVALAAGGTAAAKEPSVAGVWRPAGTRHAAPAPPPSPPPRARSDQEENQLLRGCPKKRPAKWSAKPASAKLETKP